MNRQGQNLVHPVAKYERHTANLLQAYLLLPVAGNNHAVTRVSQAVNGNTVTVNLADGFGAKHVKIVRSKKGGIDSYELSLDTASAGAEPNKPAAPR